MYKAGIAGYFAPRAVFPSLVGRPRVLRILAGTDLKYSCSGMCKAGFSRVSAPHTVCLRCTGKLDFRRWRLFFSGPLYLAVTCSSCLPEEYRFGCAPGQTRVHTQSSAPPPHHHTHTHHTQPPHRHTHHQARTGL